MKIIIGLGNPGKKYKNNRHNVGQMVIDTLKNSKTQKLKNSKQTKILKSDKFMNDSGSFVNKKLTAYGLQSTDLYIVHDDLDIPLGMFKIQFGKGPKGHNGILDIEEKLGTNKFWRVRVGVDNRLQVTGLPAQAGDSVQGEQYVLEDFTNEERVILNKVIIKISQKIASILA